MFEFLARRTYALRWVFIGIGVLILAIGIVYGANVPTVLKDTGTTAPSSESERESREVTALFPKTRESLIVLATSDTLTVQNPEYKSEFLSALQTIRADTSEAGYYQFLQHARIRLGIAQSQGNNRAGQHSRHG